MLLLDLSASEINFLRRQRLVAHQAPAFPCVHGEREEAIHSSVPQIPPARSTSAYTVPPTLPLAPLYGFAGLCIDQSLIGMSGVTNANEEDTDIVEPTPSKFAVVNGRRLCYVPQPRANLNWTEINSAWSALVGLLRAGRSHCGLPDHVDLGQWLGRVAVELAQEPTLSVTGSRKDIAMTHSDDTYDEEFHNWSQFLDTSKMDSIGLQQHQDECSSNNLHHKQLERSSRQLDTEDLGVRSSSKSHSDSSQIGEGARSEVFRLRFRKDPALQSITSKALQMRTVSPAVAGAGQCCSC